MLEQSQESLASGTVIGDYVIEAEIGGGGMARVYRVRHKILETVHAIKVLEPQFRADANVRRRFLDEARIQAKHLDHPNIVKVTNIVASDVAGLVMELVDGPSLDDYILQLKRPLSLDELRALMLPILAGVGHAHQRGIIHRDIKPANILLARSEDGGWLPKVTDFGIAKVTDEAGGSLAVNKKSTNVQRMGTLSYMSPEQIRAPSTVTARSDVFSLGALLYEMATGTVAFEGASQYDVMDNIMKGIYEPPQRRAAGLVADVAAAIATALQPDPALRHASCEDFARALRAASPEGVRPVAAGNVPAAAPAAPAPRPAPAVGVPARAPGPAATSGASVARQLAYLGALVLLVGVGFLLLRSALSDKPQPVLAPQPAPDRLTREKLTPPADASSTASGLRFKIERAGNGSNHPKAYDAVTVHYTGWTMDGRKFDSSVDRGQPSKFPLAGVIPGWSEAVQLMVVGEKTRFWIPARLAYGDKPKRQGAPAGRLVFDIELLDIESQSAAVPAPTPAPASPDPTLTKTPPPPAATPPATPPPAPTARPRVDPKSCEQGRIMLARGDRRSAFGWFTQCLRELPGSSPEGSIVEGHLISLRRQLGRLTILVRENNVAVRVNGLLVGYTPLPDGPTIMVEPGLQTIVISKSGASARAERRVGAGQSEMVSLSFAR